MCSRQLRDPSCWLAQIKLENKLILGFTFDVVYHEQQSLSSSITLGRSAFAKTSLTSSFLCYDWLRKSVCAHLPYMASLFSPWTSALLVPCCPAKHLIFCSRSVLKFIFPFLRKQVFVLHAGPSDCASDKRSCLMLRPFPLLSLAICVKIDAT